MRDPDRIPIILKQLEEIWSKHPDLRLGQLILFNDYYRDTYFIEDKELMQEMTSFFKDKLSIKGTENGG